MFDFQSPSFFTRSPCSTILYVCVCLHCWVTQKGKPFRISIIKICIWGCVYPPTLETCCKYNHIIISAKSWSNSNNSFFNNVQQNLSSFQDYYVWFSCFPNTSGWFGAMSSLMDVSFKPLEQQLPRCRRDSRESVQSEVGPWDFPNLCLLHPPKNVGSGSIRLL